MSFKISDYFDTEKIEKIRESKTKVHFLSHKKTKAQVLYFENENENAGFSTYFHTPCSNSKGTTHILEHSVFEGSRKYDQENSLDFILNNSLNSSFNAMTFPDKTGYYFCSSFPKDYENLLDIYLDFIYFPKLELKTLRKEGHFFKKNKDNYEFNGIVFNEMKNSLLGFYSKFYDSLSELFEPGSYSYISGGDPIDIVDLTHDELVSYHKNHYHPSNSFTIIYGKINKKKVFSKLNDIFSEFKYSNNKIELIANPITNNKKIEVAFQNNNEEEENHFCKYYLFKDIETEEDYFSLELTKSYLLGYDFSPLRRILEDSKLCSSVEDIYLSETKFPILAVLCRGVKKEDRDKLENLIDSHIIKFSKKVPSEIKNLLLKRYEFSLNEIEFYQDQAADVMFSAARFLNYGHDPLIGLRNFTTLKKIRKILRGNYLENFMQKLFLDAKTLTATFVSSSDLISEYNKKLDTKLNQKLENMNLKFLDNEIIDHEKFLNSPKKDPKYKSLKNLKLKDLNLDIFHYHQDYKNKVLTTSLNSGEIVRGSFYFDMGNFDYSKTTLLGIYIAIFNQISTKKTKFDSLSLKKKRIFDQLSFNVTGFYDYHQKKQLNVFYLAFKFLYEDFKEAQNLLKEILTEIDFEDKARIKYLLNEHLDFVKEGLRESPLENATLIANSHFSPSEYVNYQLNSLPLLKELKKILSDFDNLFPELSKNLTEIHRYIYSQNCILHMGLSEDIKNNSLKLFNEFITDLNFKLVNFNEFTQCTIKNFTLIKKDLNLFYPSNSDTNFNVLAVSYPELDNSSDKNILRVVEPYMFQYLWENIRVKNGAYGSYWNLNKDYNFGTFVSYSDPKINDTYKTYLNTNKKYNLSKFKKYAFEKMKLKFLSKQKILLRNSAIYSSSFSFFIRNIDEEERKKSLNKKIQIDFVEFKNLLSEILKTGPKVKVIATTKERITAEFKEKYETIDLN